MGDHIVRELDGKYHVWVQIQDGTEFCGSFDTEDEAAAEFQSSQKILNGNKLGYIRTPSTQYRKAPEELFEDRITKLEKEVQMLKNKLSKRKVKR